MKKLIMAALAALTMIMGAYATEADNVDVYNFSMSTKVPYLKNGVRSMTSQSMKGYLYLEYTEEEITAAYAIVKNTKTKIEHTITLDATLFNRIGKSNKYTTHATPNVYVTGEDDAEGKTDDNHEFITLVAFAGWGSVSNSKTVGCSICGTGTTTYCTRISSMSGYLTGIMDCNCPEDENWDHTVEATRCEATTERSHLASFGGTWKATWNKKLSK